MPTAPGYADVSVRMSLAGMTRDAFITFGVDPVDTTTLAVATNVAAAINASGSLKTLVDSNVTFTGVRVSLGIDGTVDLAAEHPISIAGTASANSLPPNCAVLFHKTTARGGRRGRGRMFLPWGINEASVDEAGIITPAILTTMQTAASAFLTALATNTVPMYLLHNPGISVAGAPDIVTFLSVDNLISTQRRRLGR